MDFFSITTLPVISCTVKFRLCTKYTEQSEWFHIFSPFLYLDIFLDVTMTKWSDFFFTGIYFCKFAAGKLLQPWWRLGPLLKSMKLATWSQRAAEGWSIAAARMESVFAWWGGRFQVSLCFSPNSLSFSIFIAVGYKISRCL